MLKKHLGRLAISGNAALAHTPRAVVRLNNLVIGALTFGGACLLTVIAHNQTKNAIDPTQFASAASPAFDAAYAPFTSEHWDANGSFYILGGSRNLFVRDEQGKAHSIPAPVLAQPEEKTNHPPGL